MGLDLITLEVLRHKVDVIADEMEIALLKSAYSSMVKEGMDASSALCLRTALRAQRVEALRHTHVSVKRDGTSGKG
jgi:N-methylhydantoinase B/oxoprolinase/acetone carboxylase alpha subunit